MTDVAAPRFLDVDAMLVLSQPRVGPSGLRLAAGGVLVAVAMGWFFARNLPNAQDTESLIFGIGVAVAAGLWAAAGFVAMRGVRWEHIQLSAVEELIQLRRWPEAAMRLESQLMRPAMSLGARAQGLLFLATTLARYHRFDDAVRVYNHLLDEIPLDDSAVNLVRMGRAMALLRDEKLFDADRAIAELRRGNRGMASTGLALIEMYRDVKTGHPAEAVEMFEKSLPAIRREMGHRSADAWALAARAYDLLGRPADAAKAFENATLLAPAGELCRRYPEVAPLLGKFVPAPAPKEVA